MTAAYSQPDWDKPVGSDTGPNVPTKARDNLRVLRDGLLVGKIKDWTFERVNGTGTADEPQYWRFKNTVNNIWFRMTNTWTSAKITSQVVEWSDDGGSTWASVMAADTIVYDGSLNITSQSIGSGIYVFILELIAKVKKVVSDLSAHTAATGTAVHGLGTMSTQAKTAVDIDGGTADALVIGDSSQARATVTRVREATVDLGAIANGGTATPDCGAASYFKLTPSATQSHTATIANPSNPPSSAFTHTITIEIINGKRDVDGRFTWGGGYHFLGGSSQRPHDDTLELSGSNLFVAQWNGSSWDVTHLGKRG